MAQKVMFDSSLAKASVLTSGDAAGSAVSRAVASEGSLERFADGLWSDEAGGLLRVVELCGELEAEFIARTAVHSRQVRRTREVPALLLSILTMRDPGLFSASFDLVVDDFEMVSAFVRMIRSGISGRKSLGSLPRRKVREWLAARSDEETYRLSFLGAQPGLVEIIRMVHPKPATKSREALYGYLTGREVDPKFLPDCVLRSEGERDAALSPIPLRRRVIEAAF